MTKTKEKQGFPNIHLLIPAAGTGSRLGTNTPKQFQKISNKTILEHSLEKFKKINNLSSVVIILDKYNITHFDETVHEFHNVQKIVGGNTRKESIYKGLLGLENVNDDDIILTHDAARPLINLNDINNVIACTIETGAATLAQKVSDTLLKDNKTIDRLNMWAIQTPQAFRYKDIMSAHEQFISDDSFTDDASIMRTAGHKVEIVEAKHPNFKITTQADFDIVKTMIEHQQKTETRTASGFDVHAFEETTTSSRPFIIGGLKIDYPRALKGHSDADVVLHALTDALLGTIADGDIGVHFPPSDPQWKNADSTQFLIFAAQRLKEKSAKISLVDITIMAEEPKISPLQDAMRNKIADILSISTERVSIKATTTEKLGFIGRKEGIACQALATITLPIPQENEPTC